MKIGIQTVSFDRIIATWRWRQHSLLKR